MLPLEQERRECVPCHHPKDDKDVEVEEEVHERLAPCERPLVAEAPSSGTAMERAMASALDGVGWLPERARKVAVAE
jgi:hypothetical protein